MELTAKIFIFSNIIFIFLKTISSTSDSISGNQTIRDDVDNTIESAGGIFELGFFSPGKAKNRYIGIWYKNIPNRTVVWIANRDAPIVDHPGELRIHPAGNLELVDAKRNVVWSTSSSLDSVTNPTAQLLDNGNFLVRNGNDSSSQNYIWKSFDYPGDTILPGMKLGWDFEKGLNRNLTSWRNVDDPSPGNYTLAVELNGYPTIVVWNASTLQFRFGPYDGVQFSGLYVPRPEMSFLATAVLNRQEVYFKYDISNSSVVMRAVLSLNGTFQILRWEDQTQNWAVYLDTQKDVCEQYGRCGKNGICNQTLCECFTGFEPDTPGNWSNGCVRRTKLCGEQDGFMKYPGLKFPDSRKSWFDPRMTLADCEKKCSSNCSCTGYSNVDIRLGGTGCLLWFDDLIDMRNYNNGLDFYVKVAASDIQEVKKSSNRKGQLTIVVVAALAALALLVGIVLIVCYRKRKQQTKVLFEREIDASHGEDGKELDLPLFNFIEIANATNNFSEVNKLGEGGFGPVYKGVLSDGQEIAVKRLSKDSRQGLDEFKNEVSVIAKLQHKNLVRLLGCCIKSGEMLLIYEYMTNKSLDSLIYDNERSKTLDWPRRLNIINGIAKGLLYLHHDSRLTIIHRDLKAGNILLDYEMNPKISDFGLAKSFNGNEREANTTRVVGTFGYMAPEYAFEGLFSFKSDIYSFGVLLLEIVSGIKMKGFYNSDPDLNLLKHAWRLYKEDKCLDLINKEIIDTCNQSEVVRVIQIGLLCVQPYPDDRPGMDAVVLMLSSKIEVDQPKEPSFFNNKSQKDNDYSSSKRSEASSSNKLTITDFTPR